MLMRDLASTSVPAIGLGCMNLSHAYGPPTSREAGLRLLERAFELGIRHFDSAALYGFGQNEELLAPFVRKHRDDILLVSKCGIRKENGTRTIDGHPEKLRQDLEHSLRRLQTDVIDLYYLHRYDKVTPIEDSVGEMSRFVSEGKVRAIGLSEVSAETLRKAHAVHPLAAVQSEYSPWSRNVEIAVLDACARLGIAFVAFSPLARGFLTSVDLDPSTFGEKDIRSGMPRFKEPHFADNRAWLPAYRVIADEAGCTPAQLALAWVLQRGDHVHAIPGTTSIAHLEEDFAALDTALPEDALRSVEDVVNRNTVSGGRYSAPTQAEIDTEEFS